MAMAMPRMSREQMMETVMAMMTVMSIPSMLSEVVTVLGVLRKRLSPWILLSCSFFWMNMRNSRLGLLTISLLWSRGLPVVSMVVVVLVVEVVVVVVEVVEEVVVLGPSTTVSLMDSRATIQGGRRGLGVEVSPTLLQV